jgi:DNA-binding CsgD family transcriptional regulator
MIRAVPNAFPDSSAGTDRSDVDEYGVRRLVGRDHELAHLDNWLDDVVAGRSRPLLLEGEPGIGKTSLLRAVRARALRAGARPIAVSPIPTAASLTLAGLGAVLASLRPAAASGDAADPVLTMFGDGQASANPLTLCGGLVSLLAAAAEEQPVVLMIDDGQWLDQSSAEVIVAAFKGLILDRVGLLVAARSGEPHRFDEIQRLPIGGVSEAAAVQLFASLRIEARVMSRCWEATGGNPLALDVVLHGMDEQQRRGASPMPEPLPVADSIATAFRRRVEALPAATRSALVVLAADTGLSPGSMFTALTSLGHGMVDFDPAEAASIVVSSGGRLAFAHPLLRTSALATALPAQLRAAHGALAAAHKEAGELEPWAWHLAAAATSPDAEAAAALADVATTARRRGSIASAAEGFYLAARLATTRADRAAWLMAAGEATWVVGRVDDATSILGEALDACETPTERAEVAMLLGKIELWTRGPRVARDRFLGAVGELGDDNQSLASRLVSQAAATAVVSGDVLGSMDLAQDAIALAPPDDVAAVVQAELAAGYLQIHAADPTAMTRLQPIVDLAELLIDSGDEGVGGLLGLVGMCLTETERFMQAENLLRAVGRQARRNGASADSALYAAILAEKHWRTGNWLEATHLASTDVAEGTYLPVNLAWAAAVVAHFDAAAGRAEACRERAAGAVRVGRTTSAGVVLIWAGHAMGLLEVGFGRWAAAARQLDRVAALTESLGRHQPGAVWWQGDHIEALVRSGRLDDAAHALERLDAERAVGDQVWPACVAARGRALLATDIEIAIAEFARSIELASSLPAPFEVARSRLNRGERLIQEGSGGEAVHDLREALDAFERLGAASFAERTRAMLGDPMATRSTVGLDELLTPGELRVALAVAKGATNREVGADLFVSVKTVDYHLQNIYRKLNLRSRTELAVRVSQAAPN